MPSLRTGGDENSDLNEAADLIGEEALLHFTQFFFWGWLNDGSNNGRGRWVLKLSDEFDMERLRELAAYINRIGDQ